MKNYDPEVQFIFKPCNDRLKAEKIIKIFYTALKRHKKEAQNDAKMGSFAKKAVGRSG